MGLEEIGFHFGAAVRRIVEGETKFRWVRWRRRCAGGGSVVLCWWVCGGGVQV